ncbi:hypothetical protein HMPREF7215_1626 [Pyramidobacter piscolens W5455]|uniref:Uncharacterized protein n=2 Tax=Pyramidobacter piscolens TaxID=638849 RepID=A0ABM9ZW28_9BACT|nr:hypothetical protein HMPREF7215_1626 [Pyramidobacter piscolens W5455]
MNVPSYPHFVHFSTIAKAYFPALDKIFQEQRSSFKKSFEEDSISKRLTPKTFEKPVTKNEHKKFVFNINRDAEKFTWEKFSDHSNFPATL